MINLPEKFETYLNKGRSTPVTMVKLANDVLENVQTSGSEWANNTSESTVDYTTSPGDVLLEADSVPNVASATSDTYETLSGSGVTTYAWQSFKQTTGAPKTLDRIAFNYDINNTGFNFFLYWEIYNSAFQKIGNTRSTIISTDYTGEYISQGSFGNVTLLNNTTYWAKTWADPLAVGPYVRLNYDSSSAAYADGRLDFTGSTTYNHTALVKINENEAYGS